MTFFHFLKLSFSLYPHFFFTLVITFLTFSNSLLTTLRPPSLISSISPLLPFMPPPIPPLCLFLLSLFLSPLIPSICFHLNLSPSAFPLFALFVSLVLLYLLYIFFHLTSISIPSPTCSLYLSYVKPHSISHSFLSCAFPYFLFSVYILHNPYFTFCLPHSSFLSFIFFKLSSLFLYSPSHSSVPPFTSFYFTTCTSHLVILCPTGSFSLSSFTLPYFRFFHCSLPTSLPSLCSFLFLFHLLN